MTLPEEIRDFRNTLEEATKMMSLGAGLTHFTEAQARELHEHFNGDSVAATTKYGQWVAVGNSIGIERPETTSIVKSMLAKGPEYTPENSRV